jgi:hypothetical protein
MLHQLLPRGVRRLRRERWRLDAEDDVHLVAVDLDPPDQEADQPALLPPVELIEVLPDTRGERLEPPDDQRQLRAQPRPLDEPAPLLLQARQALPQPGDARLELGPLDQALGVAVDQPADPAPQPLQLGLDGRQVPRLEAAIPAAAEAPLVFRRDPARIAQQPLHLAPDGRLEEIGPDLRVVAHPLPAEAVAVGARAAVVRVAARLAGRRVPAARPPVAPVPAAPADHEALQQVPLAARALAAAAPVLRELLLNGREQGGIDDGRHRDADPLGRVDGVTGGAAPRLAAAAADRPQPRPERPRPRLAERRPAGVGRVLEQAPHGAPLPGDPGARAAAGLPQAAADLADADPVVAEPPEHLPDHRRLVLDDLVAGHAAAVPLVGVAVAVGRRRQHADRAAARGVALAAAAPLEDLGALVLGHHALDLQEQVVLRRHPDRAVEEHDLGAAAAELVEQQHLVGVAAGQAIGRVDVYPVDGAGGDEVAQPLEPRADERGAAVALVDEAAGGLEAGAVLRQARLQGRELARDGAALHLLVGRDASVDGDAHGRHGRPLLTALSATGASGVARPAAPTGAKRRTIVGASRSKASARSRPPSRSASWLTRTVRVDRFASRRLIGTSTVRRPFGWPMPLQHRRRRTATRPIPQAWAWDGRRQLDPERCNVVTGVSSPARRSRARLSASRRLVLTRSPGFLGTSDGATTTHECPRPVSSRCSP